MKLTEADYKLLSYLYHHSRESVSKIAKATELTREQVEYRLKKYTDEGLIRGFFSLFDYGKFGYDYFVTVLLKFEKHSSTAKFSKGLVKHKNVISWGKVFGKYDLFMNCVFKDEKELSDFISELLKDKENSVSDYFVVKPYFAELYPLKFVRYKDRDNYGLVDEKSKVRKFDENEKKILKILANDGRVRLIDIAGKVGLSSELVLYKLKKLYGNKVILGSRIQFDMSKLGYYFSLILLNVRNFDEANREKIKKFARQSEHVNSLILSLARPNCIIQLFHREESELRKSIEKIRELFSKEFVDIDIMLLGEDEEGIDTLPFL